MTVTPEEFFGSIKEILEGQHCGDHEVTHGLTDGLMEQVLRQLGYSKGVDLIEESKRWYS